MRIRRWADMDDAARSALFNRGLGDIFEPSLRASIGALIDDVRERGDAAVCDALARFDHIELTPSRLRVTGGEIESAKVTAEVDEALDDAIAHVRAFNEAQVAHSRAWSFESEPGLTVGEKLSPVASAGLFVPSGKASYPSVAYQLATPAVVAGVDTIVLVVPPVPAAAARSTRPCSWCAANSASPRCSGSTGRPASPRSASAPRPSRRCAWLSAPARRRSRSPRSRCSATA